MSGERDRLMSQEALVIERALNGIIVRPHAGYWRRDNSPIEAEQIRVFNTIHAFQAWFADWFPIEASESSE